MRTSDDSALVRESFERALELSRVSMGTSSPNPPVGAVIVADDGAVVGDGRTQPPGGPHAEVMALRAAGSRARGATAVVTLEPCNHTGRTGPCSAALIDAGVRTVYFGAADPNPAAAGGAAALRAAGVEVVEPAALDPQLRAAVEAGPLRPWLFRQRTGRPLITAKIAATVDGRIAAPDGSSRWITGPQARAHAHERRSRIDGLVVGTGTVLADDPALTARTADGELRAHQPTRIVLGRRDIDPGANVLDARAPTLHVRSHDPREVVAAVPEALWLVVEGGPTVLGAFFGAGLVDEIDYYLAPAVLGAGRAALDIDGTRTIADLQRFAVAGIEPVGDDVLLTLRRR